MTSASSPDSAELAQRRIGDVVAGKWRLERVLGVGGMAAVYAARHTNNLRLAALKLLHPELAANADIRRRFLREGYFANKIGHAGAVAILDDGVDEGDIFLAMELLEGESLASRRDREPPPGRMGAAETLRIAEKLLDVLAAAHTEGIVHRDLKPDNVFLMKDGTVKVLDFGIARLLDPPGSEEATRTGVMMGTPQYMPPEQARGRAKLVDARSDIFAVGAILFAVLTGRHVHEAETSNESLLRAMTTPAPSLRSVLPGVGPRTALVVDRAMAFEPDDRWQDARGMQAAVREALAEADEEPASSLALAPTQLSVGKVAPAVTRAPTPVVNDVRHSRSSGGRVALVVILSLGAGVAGASWVMRSPLFARMNTGGGVGVVAPPPVAPAAARSLAGELGDASPTDAGAQDDLDASAAKASVAEGAIDAAGEDPDANPDADTEDEDDDGGDDDEVVFDAGRAAIAAGKPIGHATHKAAPPPAPARKKHHKKRVKH